MRHKMQHRRPFLGPFPFHRILGAGLALVLAISGLMLAPAPGHATRALPHSAAPQAGAWASKITVTPSGGHVLGNPAASVKLTEYMSYTCPHCAHFAAEADVPLRLAFIPSGKGSFEIRHFLRDPVDMTVALLTNCGNPQRFFLLHEAFLSSQPNWMDTVQKTSESQRQRWTNGSLGERMRAIASDLHFYDIMDAHGFDRSTVDRCLSDEAMARRLSVQTVEAQKLGVDGTPSFSINGVLLAGTHDWNALKLQLDARL